MATSIEATDNLIQSVKDSVETKIITTEGRDFSTRQIHAIPRPKDAEVSALELNTLSGIVDYLAANVDKLDKATLVLHIVSEREVLLRSALFGQNKQREVYARSTWKSLFTDEFQFDAYHEVEEFIIGLKTLFAPGTGVDDIIKVVGNLEQQASRTNTDDGFSQIVTSKRGIKVGNVEIQNPVTLAPFRTFREIPQPESPFILRLQGTGGDNPECALFEADGGKWRLDAINSIKTYFKSAGTEVSIIC